MNARCSCGATLVEGALFCHRCGQPQREDLIERERLADVPVSAPEHEAEATEAPPVGPAPSGFDTHRATRAALMAAIPCFFLVPVVVVLLGGAGVLTLLPAGFFAVYLYGRGAAMYRSATGQDHAQPLSLRAGARLGWITGMFTFVLTLIPIALASVFSETPLREMFRKQIEAQPVSGPDVQNAIDVLNSPAGFAAIIGTGLVFLFVAFTVLAALGGAVAAQMQLKAGEKKLT